jgi:hypothetical protein
MSRRDVEGRNNQAMRSSLGSRAAVHVHHRIAIGGYLGRYELWTLLVQHPILSTVAFGVASNYATKLIDALAKKAHALLKRAMTRGKRVDIMIPFEGQSWVIARVIGRPPPDEPAGGIPSEDEVHQALMSATQARQNAYQKESGKPLVITAELHVKEGPAWLHIRTSLGSRLGPAVEKQIAKARSEKPVSLRLGKSQVGCLGSRRRRKQRVPSVGCVLPARLHDSI